MSPTIGPGRMIATSHDEVVEVRRLQPRQRRHLRARLDLEDADGVGLLQQLVDGGVVGRNVREVEALALGPGAVAGASDAARSC